MRFRLLRSIVALIAGVAFCCFGVFFMGAYVVEAVWTTAGLPDRSSLFWYLPVLFIGFFCRRAESRELVDFSFTEDTQGEIDTVSENVGCLNDDKEGRGPSLSSWILALH